MPADRLPLGRNAEFLDINIKYTIDVVGTGVLLGMFPEVLKP